MAVKSIVSVAPKADPYPCLMECQAYVVLFSASGNGTVIRIKDNSRATENIGYHSKEWIMSSFAPFNNSIVLCNGV